ncbi:MULTISPECIES: acyl carrier protein [Streptomyces]|jgi:acyl carrier protein|uniref:Acyl carrier protein n=3 Tax=Streptomyces TaxID=1883 RepID=A0A6M4PGP3_9ACTN|nr:MULTISPECIES: acyl carrier protein [Streptomyces]AEY91187.1 phosphopantetheine-binding protein [Streptomyces hygroscopicus subsp. jinggangensis 5008]AGF65345.1 phosphopantetheine-binding protein [Streptomyces hygroscopicus subsp. jinggangensis TL01]ALO95658.1 Phosphopantetheine-binding protein [Streptomyces hygroscopicus subsp. limoneus]KUN30399.1 acyl carrier protein [Streptomyces corchorusii]QJS10398.1 acyl carrier protein [Streptomyces argyrophyllae]
MTENTLTERGRYLDAVRQGLTEVLNKDVTGAEEGVRLFDELGLDSSSALELLITIEEILDVQFDAEELEMTHFETVGSLADFVAAEAGA